MPELTGFQKLDRSEQSLKAGDYPTLKETVGTVQDQKLFMTLLADRVKDQTGSLPGLKIVDIDNDGSPESITAKGLTISKGEKGMTVTSESLADRTKEKIVDGYRAAKEALKSVTGLGSDLGDALDRANTNDSNLNRRWKDQEKKNGI